MMGIKSYSDMKSDTRSAVSAVPIKCSNCVFDNHVMPPTDVKLITATVKIKPI